MKMTLVLAIDANPLSAEEINKNKQHPYHSRLMEIAFMTDGQLKKEYEKLGYEMPSELPADLNFRIEECKVESYYD